MKKKTLFYRLLKQYEIAENTLNGEWSTNHEDSDLQLKEEIKEWKRQWGLAD